MYILIVSTEPARQRTLMDAVRAAPRLPIRRLESCDTTAAARDVVRTWSRCDLIILAEGVSDSDKALLAALHDLNSTIPGTPVIVEVAGDDPLLAFSLLRDGAYNVFAKPFQQEFFEDAVVRAIGRSNAPYQRMLAPPSLKDGESWAFMSMDFGVGTKDFYSYFHGVRPTMDALGLPKSACSRADECDDHQNRLSVRDRTLGLIDARQVLFALYSSPDPATPANASVMYEMGHAEKDNKKTVITLWRRTSQKITVMAKPNLYIDFQTNTELAMRLFFGLHGSYELLKTTWKDRQP